MSEEPDNKVQAAHDSEHDTPDTSEQDAAQQKIDFDSSQAFPEAEQSSQKMDDPDTVETIHTHPAHRVADSGSQKIVASSEEDRRHGRDTAVLANKNQRLRQKLEENAGQGTATLGEQREIIFVIRGMVERFLLTEDVSVILGRADPGARPRSDVVNLTPYGALDRGVSRAHAKLHLKENHLYVIDLDSTNGTYLAGKRLEPNEPTLLRKGDELLLGRLAIQVLFR